jgi:hypothetical protein
MRIDELTFKDALQMITGKASLPDPSGSRRE